MSKITMSNKNRDPKQIKLAVTIIVIILVVIAIHIMGLYGTER